MKLGLTLASLVAGQRLGPGADPEDRIWVPDPTNQAAVALSENNLSTSFTLPVNPSTGKYDPNEYVRISATAPDGYKIVASFTNFKLEGADFRGDCRNDAVVIYDGPDGNGELETYCGRDRRAGFTKPDVSTSANEMTVVFKSNENRIVSKGFTVTFTAVELPAEDFAVNAITNAFNEVQSLVYVGHFHKNNPKIHNKKAAHMQRIFERYAFVFDYTSDNCAEFAGTGNAADFVAPVIDEDNKCGSVDSLLDSFKSFYTAFGCNDGYDFTTDPVGRAFKAYHKRINKDKIRLRTKKFNTMCANDIV